MASRLRQAGGQSDEFDPEIAALCLFALIEGGNRAVFRGELEATVPVLASEIARFVQRIADPG
jgi:hypothetical protein